MSTKAPGSDTSSVEPTAGPTAGGTPGSPGANPKTSTIRSLATTPAIIVSLLCLAGYFLISRVVLDLFPFSTYSMYSSVSASHHGDTVRGCQLLALGPDGRPCDVREYRAWECPTGWEDAARKSVSDLSCPMYYNVEDPIREYIKKARAEGPSAGVPVDLVRRVWAFEGGRAGTKSDHPVVSCRAVPR